MISNLLLESSWLAGSVQLSSHRNNHMPTLPSQSFQLGYLSDIIAGAGVSAIITTINEDIGV
jgi:hypothetical protein